MHAAGLQGQGGGAAPMGGAVLPLAAIQGGQVHVQGHPGSVAAQVGHPSSLGGGCDKATSAAAAWAVIRAVTAAARGVVVLLGVTVLTLLHRAAPPLLLSFAPALACVHLFPLQQARGQVFHRLCGPAQCAERLRSKAPRQQCHLTADAGAAGCQLQQ